MYLRMGCEDIEDVRVLRTYYLQTQWRDLAREVAGK